MEITMTNIINEIEMALNRHDKKPELILFTPDIMEMYEKHFYHVMHPAMEFKPQYKGIPIEVFHDELSTEIKFDWK
jgi:hypothetical protein